MTTYNFTIKAINAGTDGSSAGHVWVSVQPTDMSAPAQSFGFYLDGMHYDDDSTHIAPDFERTWQITQDQKNRLDQFIADYTRNESYLMPVEVCIDFAVAAARAAAVDIRQHGDGPLFPGHFNDWIDEEGLPNLFDAEVGIDFSVNADFLSARGWRGSSPLVLDLDGDGIETVGATSYDAVLFDHDGDGMRTGTGWVKADDGLLVWDRDGNGSIDNGGELFGVHTVLANGQKAADGFAALRELDGNADGSFNSADAAYASVKVWRDMNQDGISQAGELLSLSQAGIAALDLNATPTSIALPGNNQQFLTTNYTRTDGGTATLADINFADNPFYREFPDHLDTTAVANLPDMQGSGRLRDLKEAATLSTALANQLADLQTNYRTHDQFEAELETLIRNWANTSDWSTTPVDYQAPTLFSDGDFSGLPIAETSPGLHLMQAPAILGGGMVPYAIIYLPDGIAKEQLEAAYRVPLDGSAPPLPEKYLRAVYLIETLERYNGLPFINFNIETGSVTNAAGTAIPPEQAGGGSAQTYPIPVYVPISNAQLDLLEQSYTELKGSMQDALVLQTRLKGYMDAIALQIDANGIRLDFAGVETMLDDRKATEVKVGPRESQSWRVGISANENWRMTA